MIDRLYRFRTVSAILILTSGLMGCSRNAGSENGLPQTEVVLSFTYWGSAQREELTNKAIALFEKKNPGIKIDAKLLANTNAVLQDAAIANARQNAPDLIQSDYNFMSNLANRKLLEPLEPYAEAKTLKLDGIDPSLLEPGKGSDGKMYAVSLGSNTNTFLINPELFQTYNVKIPEDGYTMEDFYNTMLELKRKVKTPGFAPLGGMIELTYYLRANGGSMYNAEGTDLGYADDKPLVDYFDAYQKWKNEGLIYSPPSGTTVGTNKNHPLITGQTAFYPVVTNNTGPLSSYSPTALKLIPYPKVNGSQAEGNYIKPSMFLSISSYSEHKKEAARFIDFLLHDLEANEILNGERGVPIHPAVANHLVNKADDHYKQQYLFMDYLKSHSAPMDAPPPKYSATISNIYSQINKKVTAGTVTPEQAAYEYRKAALAILNPGSVKEE